MLKFEKLTLHLIYTPHATTPHSCSMKIRLWFMKLDP